MGAQNIARQLHQADGIFLPGEGYIIHWGKYGAAFASAPSTTVFAKNCLLINRDGGADAGHYVNEGDGYGSAPTWTAVAVLGA